MTRPHRLYVGTIGEERAHEENGSVERARGPHGVACEELLYPVKEPVRSRSSNIGEPTMNQLDGGGTRRRRTASAVSRRLQW